MLDLNDSFGIFCKIYFDGYDFLQTDFGKILIHKTIQDSIKKLTYIDELYANADKFIDYCKIERLKYNDSYIGGLEDKYNVGRYKLSMSFDENNPWCGDYILFNKKHINGLFMKNVPDLEFWVCPAYNNGVEDIGFRIINPDLVHKSFKWLFPKGNNIIYGKDTVNPNEKCYIVEGFRDYVALNELGYNCIGLGSVFLSEKQIKYIDTLKEPILLLDNDNFGMKQGLDYSFKYKMATLCGTKQKDAWDAFYNGDTIKIIEVK